MTFYCVCFPCFDSKVLEPSAYIWLVSVVYFDWFTLQNIIGEEIWLALFTTRLYYPSGPDRTLILSHPNPNFSFLCISLFSSNSPCVRSLMDTPSLNSNSSRSKTRDPNLNRRLEPHRTSSPRPYRPASRHRPMMIGCQPSSTDDDWLPAAIDRSWFSDPLSESGAFP